MRNYGQQAYSEYRRIHLEQGIKLPEWPELKHVQRLGWEAAAFKFVDENNLPKKQVQNR